MTYFLKEVNTINEKIRSRKLEIKDRMTQLHEELGLLKHSISTPKVM